MQTLSVLHLGDIHYPQYASLPAAELADPLFGASFLDALAPKRLKSAVDAVNHLATKRKDCVGILLSGDLTSFGSIDGYKDCLKYLDGAFSGLAIWTTDQVRVVPGNHDIDREADTTSDELARFRGIEGAWVDMGFPSCLALTGLNAVTLTHRSAKVRVQSANSCLGCGEVRRYSPELHTVITEQVAKLKAAGADVPQVFELVGERLDTPAFKADDLDLLVEDIKDSSGGVLNIMLAHHAILPQARPRVVMYTELLNGGRARTQLSELGHSVIYCHGHIHESPIEVVSQPDQYGQLVAIAAPELIDGFNLVTIYFAPDRARMGVVGDNEFVPLGCEITRYCAQAHGGLRPNDPVRVTLAGPKQVVLLKDDLLMCILDVVTPTPARFNDILAKVQIAQGAATAEDVAERLLELEWVGMVEVANRNEHSPFWQIQRVGL